MRVKVFVGNTGVLEGSGVSVFVSVGILVGASVAVGVAGDKEGPKAQAGRNNTKKIIRGSFLFMVALLQNYFF